MFGDCLVSRDSAFGDYGMCVFQIWRLRIWGVEDLGIGDCVAWDLGISRFADCRIWGFQAFRLFGF